ncbi:carbohydrate ABC transporter permease [Carboxydichorda subterranea]
MRRREEMRGWLLASPYLLFSLIFFVVPFAWAAVLVFTRWDLISPQRHWVGLANFAEALASPRVQAAFWTPFKFMAIFLPTVLVAAIAIALLVNSLGRWSGLAAVGFFMPYLASGVAMALVVQGILSYNSPVSDVFFRLFGDVPDWLGVPALAITVIALMIAWKFSGYYALIFLAGLQSIPRELYEAAAIDGAGQWTSFWRITLPQLYPALYSVMILAVGLMFGIFTEPYMLTGGGPDLATHTWYLEIYYQAFSALRAGYASAVAVLNAVAVFLVLTVVRRLMEWWGRATGWV